MAATKTARNEAMTRERAAGRSYGQIARRHQVSDEAARMICRREVKEALDRLELNLMVARKTGQVVLYAVPNRSGPDFDQAMCWITFALRSLDERGVQVAVEARTATNGVVFAFTDATDYSGGKS